MPLEETAHAICTLFDEMNLLHIDGSGSSNDELFTKENFNW